MSSTVIDDDVENDERWTPITEDTLNEMFGSSSTEEIDNTNWDALDYGQLRDAEYYAKHFPGFSSEIHQILAECDGTYKPKNDKLNLCETREQLNQEIQKTKSKKRYIVHLD